MANEFLITKWKLWYKSLDVNHDGKISMEDVEESRDKFSDLHHLNTEQGKAVKDNFQDWWDKYVFRGKTGDISEQEFVDSLNNAFKADKAKFAAEMDTCFNIFFDVIDTNKDRSISQDEFLIAFKAYGHEDVAKDNAFFSAYCPEDGLVPLRTIVDSWIDFAVSTDDKKNSIVKTAFEAGC